MEAIFTIISRERIVKKDFVTFDESLRLNDLLEHFRNNSMHQPTGYLSTLITDIERENRVLPSDKWREKINYRNSVLTQLLHQF